MTFEQLDYFIAAIKCKTFFEAAETLHIAQSTLSKQIINLEKELNLQLFDRSKRSAALTDAGKMFYEEAIILSRKYHQMRLNVRRFQESSNLELHIGTLPILAQYNLTPLLKDFADQNIQIKISHDEVEEQELLEGLSQDRFDIIIARSHMLDIKKHSFYPLAEDSLKVILPLGHQMSDKDGISIEEIADENFILMHPYTSIYQLCISIFSQADIKPNIIRTARMESIISSVAIGEGISLFAGGNFKLFQQNDVIAIPLKFSPKLSIVAAKKKAGVLTPATLKFINFIKLRLIRPFNS